MFPFKLEIQHLGYDNEKRVCWGFSINGSFFVRNGKFGQWAEPFIKLSGSRAIEVISWHVAELAVKVFDERDTLEEFWIDISDSPYQIRNVQAQDDEWMTSIVAKARLLTLDGKEQAIKILYNAKNAIIFSLDSAGNQNFYMADRARSAFQIFIKCPQAKLLQQCYCPQGDTTWELSNPFKMGSDALSTLNFVQWYGFPAANCAEAFLDGNRLKVIFLAQESFQPMEAAAKP